MLKVANSVINASRITGVLPVANGGTGVTTSTGTGNTVLSASPTLSGDVTLSTGNLVIGTAGKGIDFSITSHPAGMTSELLADYEEGTFSPTITSGITGITYSSQNGSYTKVGRLVTFSLRLELSAGTAAAAILRIGGLPFTADGAFRGYASAYNYASSSVVNSTSTNLPTMGADAGGATMSFYTTAGNAFNGTDLNSASSFSVDLSGMYYA
jgi:hypothetical protein